MQVSCKQHYPDNYHTLLGKPMRSLYETFGEPFSEVLYRGNNALMFETDDGIVIFETNEDIVLSVNSFKDRRSATRIRPLIDKPANLSFNGDQHLGKVIDISSKSVAIKMSDEVFLPKEGNKVDFCTVLETWTSSRNHITLAGTVLRVIAKESRVIVLFEDGHKTQSHWLLQEYINQSLLREHISPIITSRPPTSKIMIIKSDICRCKCDINQCVLS